MSRAATTKTSRPPVADLDARRASNKTPAGVVDLPNYAPAYFSWIANKLSGGASQAYLRTFDVGIETWSLLLLLAREPSWSAQRVCKMIGMDKASVSRAFKRMQERGLITIRLDPGDGRLRVASITPAGRALHDKIIGIALERDRALMSVLSPEERKVLLDFLHRLNDNLPGVELATERYLALHYPHAARRSRKATGGSGTR